MILAFDTSAAHCAAALLSDGQVLGERVEAMARGQAERLVPLLEEVLAEGHASWSDLTALGVGVGPGNFTGIRIGVSAARGLALGLGVPAVGVEAFEALALGTQGPVLASVPGPSEQVWLGGSLSALAAGPELVRPLDVRPDLAEPGLICIGAHAGTVADVLDAEARAPAEPIAVGIARIAAARFDTVEAAPRPLYLRPPNAAPSSEPGVRILDDA